MAKKKTINYLDTFVFPGIPDILYPVYAITESGKTINFKAIAYPNPRSKKRFTRQNQLSKRSLQAKIFDAIVNIGYFNPLTVWTEFPEFFFKTLSKSFQNLKRENKTKIKIYVKL